MLSWFCTECSGELFESEFPTLFIPNYKSQSNWIAFGRKWFQMDQWHIRVGLLVRQANWILIKNRTFHSIHLNAAPWNYVLPQNHRSPVWWIGWIILEHIDSINSFTVSMVLTWYSLAVCTSFCIFPSFNCFSLVRMFASISMPPQEVLHGELHTTAFGAGKSQEILKMGASTKMMLIMHLTERGIGLLFSAWHSLAYDQVPLHLVWDKRNKCGLL